MYVRPSQPALPSSTGAPGRHVPASGAAENPSLLARCRGLKALLGAGMLVMYAVLIGLSHSTTGAATSSPSATFFGAADNSVANATPRATTPFEVGTRLTVTEAGTITALRFYKRASNKGPHVGSLWSSTGVRLRTQKFVSESVSGWQQVTLSQPLIVAAGQRLTMSYGAPSTSSPAPAPSTSSPAPAPSTSSPAPAPSTPTASGSFPTTTSAGWRASGIGSLTPYTGPSDDHHRGHGDRRG